MSQLSIFYVSTVNFYVSTVHFWCLSCGVNTPETLVFSLPNAQWCCVRLTQFLIDNMPLLKHGHVSEDDVEVFHRVSDAVLNMKYTVNIRQLTSEECVPE